LLDDSLGLFNFGLPSLAPLQFRRQLLAALATILVVFVLVGGLSCSSNCFASSFNCCCFSFIRP
jgi:hypothetical protein